MTSPLLLCVLLSSRDVEEKEMRVSVDRVKVGECRVETEDLGDSVRSSSGTDGVKLVILFGHSDFVGTVLSPFECEYGLDRGRKRNRLKGRPTRSIEAGETRARRHPLRPCLPSCPHEKKRVKRVSLGGLGDRNKAN